MNLRLISTRFAVAGVSTAVAASAMVGLASTAADAATGTATYTCTAVGQSFDVPISATGNIPAAVPSGFPVPAGLLPVTVDVTAPASVVGLLKSIGATELGMSSKNFNLSMGATKIPVVGISAPDATIPDSGDMVLTSAGSTTGKFVVPKAGTYKVKLPSSVVLTLTTDSALAPSVDATCALKAGETGIVTTVVVSKQGVTVTAVTPKPVAKNKVAKVPVKVKGQYAAPTGKVVAKEGKRIVGTGTLKKGKSTTSAVTVTLKKLRPGKHTIVLKYSGDASTNKGNATVKVTVKRR